MKLKFFKSEFLNIFATRAKLVSLGRKFFYGLGGGIFFMRNLDPAHVPMNFCSLAFCLQGLVPNRP